MQIALFTSLPQHLKFSIMHKFVDRFPMNALTTVIRPNLCIVYNFIIVERLIISLDIFLDRRVNGKEFNY